MGNNELVSVIIPVYNVFPYLREALDSVIHQTYRELEILIVDDGSTDGSGQICDEYAEQDQRICVIHQENKGLSNARNAGLNRMTGEIVAMLDPDDAYDNTFIEELKSAMDQEQADLAVGKYTTHYTTGKMIREKSCVPEPRIQAGTYDRSWMILALSDEEVNVSVWNKLYRRKLWKGIRFLDGHVCEDHEVTYRVINESKKMVVIDLPVYYHRKRPGSITATVSWKFRSDQILMASRVGEFVIENFSGVVPEENLLKIRQKYLNTLMAAYASLYKIGENFDKKTEGKKLRQQILRIGDEIGTRKFKIRTRTAYSMIRFCPWLLKITYPAYLSVRLFVYRMTGK